MNRRPGNYPERQSECTLIAKHAMRICQNGCKNMKISQKHDAKEGFTEKEHFFYLYALVKENVKQLALKGDHFQKESFNSFDCAQSEFKKPKQNRMYCINWHIGVDSAERKVCVMEKCLTLYSVTNPIN